MIRWHGDEQQRHIREALDKAIRQGAVLVQTKARMLCNRPAIRVRKKRVRRTAAGSKGSRYTIFFGSLPGQPPMLRTGFGRRNILVEYDAATLTARIGPSKNAIYMAYLEVGTDRIAPRPWLKRAAEETEPEIRRLLEQALGKSP